MKKNSEISRIIENVINFFKSLMEVTTTEEKRLRPQFIERSKKPGKF